MKCSYSLLKTAGLICGLLFLFSSCSKTPSSRNTNQNEVGVLQGLINSGTLLNEVTKEGDDYVFSFETETIRIPQNTIKSVTNNPGAWMTSVLFSDGTQLEIPSMGSSLDFIVNKITLNPSGYNPLSATVDVKLPTYGHVRVTVEGKNGDVGTITHLCNATTPGQKVPVFGLYPDFNNVVELAFTDDKGNVRGTTQIHIKTEPLAVQDLPKFKVIKSEINNIEPGVNLVNYPGPSIIGLSMPYMVDVQGQIRWILLLKNSPDLNNLSISLGLFRSANGNFIAGDQNGQRIVEFDMFGNLVHQWDLEGLGYTFHHDIAQEKNGNFLITVNKIGAKLSNGQPRIQDHIIELDTTSGKVLHEWDLANLVDTSRYLKPDGITPPDLAQTPTNWAHNNSIIPFNNYILTTMRYQGIIGFSFAGSLRWIISPYKYWDKKYQSYLLQPVDEDGNLITNTAVINGEAATNGFDWPWGPHTPVSISEDRFIVFDNGYNRQWISNALNPDNNYSRAVEYKIDEAKRTVQQVWSYGEERGSECYSEALSGVQYLLQTGNILFSPGLAVPTSMGLGGRVVEVQPSTKNVVFEMEITAASSVAFYRVTRMGMYPDNL